MPSKGFLYWVLNSVKKPLYINRSGHVQVADGLLRDDGKPAHTEASPTGWAESMVTWGRNNKYLGVFREFSAPLNTVRDMAKILRDAMWRLGMDAVLYLAISKLNRTQFPDTYEAWYTGEFDFSKFRQTDDGVDISLVEGGLSKLLKAYETTTFEIPVNTDAERFPVYLDGLTFKNSIESEVFSQVIFSTSFVGGAAYWALGTGIIANEGTTQGILSNDQALTPAQDPKSDNAFVRSLTKTTTINITGNIKVVAPPSGFNVVSLVNVYITKYDFAGNLIQRYEIIPPQNLSQDQSVSANYEFHIAMEPGTSLVLAGSENLPVSASDPDTSVTVSGTLNYDYLVRFDPTLAECISWWTLFQRLTAKLTDGKYGCRSAFLRTLTDQCVTSGQAIRKYQAPAVIKTSIEDFFKACRRWGVGLGIENDELVIEPHAYFFKKGKVLELGQVKDAGWDVAADLVFNTIKVGYPNQQYDKVNGRDELNVTQQYTTPHTRIVAELDLVCPYRADMFGIEITRLDLFGKDTTDNKADNDTFIMNVVKGSNYDLYRGAFTTVIDGSNYYIQVPNTEVLFESGQAITFSAGTFTIESITYIIAGYSYVHVNEALVAGSYNEAISTFSADVYHLNRPAFSSVTGLLKPAEAFNLLLSPKHSFLNNGAYIHSVLDLLETEQVVFQTGEKNSDVSTTLDGVTVTEDANVDISSLPDKLFKPYYIKFKTKVPIDLPAIMRLTPYDQIGFIYKGNKYYGYLWSGGIAPETMDSQEWTLLSAAENDLTKLI